MIAPPPRFHELRGNLRQLLALPDCDARRWEHKRLWLWLLSIPARLVRGARRTTLRLAATPWTATPWTAMARTAWGRLIPRLTTAARPAPSPRPQHPCPWKPAPPGPTPADPSHPGARISPTRRPHTAEQPRRGQDHVGSAAGAVTLARSVSSRRPSNRACGSPAHGSPTSFTAGIRRCPGCPPVPEGSGGGDDSEQVDQAEVVRGCERDHVRPERSRSAVALGDESCQAAHRVISDLVEVVARCCRSGSTRPSRVGTG